MFNIKRSYSVWIVALNVVILICYVLYLEQRAALSVVYKDIRQKRHNGDRGKTGYVNMGLSESEQAPRDNSDELNALAGDIVNIIPRRIKVDQNNSGYTEPESGYTEPKSGYTEPKSGYTKLTKDKTRTNNTKSKYEKSRNKEKGNSTDGKNATYDRDRYRHYKNVCVAQRMNSNRELFRNQHPFTANLLAYDHKMPNGSKKFHINTKKNTRVSYWIVHNSNKSSTPPTGFKMLDSVAFFPKYCRDSNQIFLLWNDQLPTALGLMEYAEKVIPRVMNMSSKVYAVMTNDTMHSHFQEMFLHLGYSKISKYIDLVEVNKMGVCFKYGIFGSAPKPRQSTLRTDVINVIHRQWKEEAGLNTSCSEKYMLIIERKGSRHILNISDLVAVAKEFGYREVRVEYFEERTLREQWGVIRCASVFVAAQGAALSWYPFLPRHAAVVEITWQGWRTRYYQRIRQHRSDVTPVVVKCQHVTPDAVWKHYAKLWFNETGTLSEKVKDHATRKSKVFSNNEATAKTIYRDGDCKCSDQTFADALSQIAAKKNETVHSRMTHNVTQREITSRSVK